MAEYILHIYNGIVHQRTDGNGHTSDTHRVDGQSQQMHHQNRDEQRNRDGYQRNDGGTCIHQEDEEHDDYEDGSFNQRALDISNGIVDERALTENLTVHMHIGRKFFFQVFQRTVQLVSQFQGADVRLFGYGNQYCWSGPIRGHTCFGRFGTDFQFGNVLQQDWRAVDVFNHGLCQFFGTVGLYHTAHNILISIFIMNATADISIDILQLFHDLR